MNEPLHTVGEYTLLGAIGRGGMGAVYLAVHQRLRRQAAIKFLRFAENADEEEVRRFEREMVAIGRLEHENIVRAYDAGAVEGTPYLVMEYVKGPSLEQLSNQHGPLGVADACEVVRQACRGLENIHQHGLVHRDIKPSNLLLTADGVVKIVDLGLARSGSEFEGIGQLTASGQIVGTADYIAPEQVQRREGVDIRADLYSLGCTMFHILAGRVPFGTPDYDSVYRKLMAHAEAEFPRLAEICPYVPVGLEEAFGRLVAKDRDARFASPQLAAEAFEGFSGGSDLKGLVEAWAAENDSPVELSGPETGRILAHAETVPYAAASAREVSVPSRRRRLVWGGLIGLLLIAGGLLIVQSMQRREDPGPPVGDAVAPGAGGDVAQTDEAGDAVFADGRGDEPGGSPDTQAGPFERKWISIFRARPSEVALFGEEESAEWHFVESQERLQLTSQNLRLMRFMKSGENSGTFSLHCEQIAWTGEFGMFFNLHRSGAGQHSRLVFQFVKLVRSQQAEGLIYWGVGVLSPEQTAIQQHWESATRVSWPRDGQAVPVRFLIDGGCIQSFYWNERPITGPQIPTDAPGELQIVRSEGGDFGAFNSSGTIRFSNIDFQPAKGTD